MSGQAADFSPPLVPPRATIITEAAILRDACGRSPYCSTRVVPILRDLGTEPQMQQKGNPAR